MDISVVGILSLTLTGKLSMECVMKIKIGLLMLVKLMPVSSLLKTNGDNNIVNLLLYYIVNVHSKSLTVLDLGIVVISMMPLSNY